MIAGNPKTGQTLVTIAVALLLLILVTASFVCLRKRTDPEKEPPLHPSTVVVKLGMVRLGSAR